MTPILSSSGLQLTQQQAQATDLGQQALALRVPGHPALSDAKKLVFAALGGRNWGVLEIEIIAGREESLLLARPASGVYLSREVLSRLAARGR